MSSLALARKDLGENAITVPRGKTAAASRRLPVDPSLWAWVDRAVPCPVNGDRLRDAWYRAQKAAKLSPVRIHDNRHLTAQWLSQAGQPLTALQAVLGHKALTMTMRYARHRALESSAAAMAGVLGDPQAGSRSAKKKRKRA